MSQGNTQLSITSNNSTCQSPLLSPETSGPDAHAQWPKTAAFITGRRNSWGLKRRHAPGPSGENPGPPSSAQSLGYRWEEGSAPVHYNYHYRYPNTYLLKTDQKLGMSDDTTCLGGRNATQVPCIYWKSCKDIRPKSLFYLRWGWGSFHGLIVLCPLTSFLFNGPHVYSGGGVVNPVPSAASHLWVVRRAQT